MIHFSFYTDLHCASCFSIGGLFSEWKWKRGGNGSELTVELNYGSHANEVMKTHTVPAVAIMNINRQRTSNGYEEGDNEASISRKNFLLPSQIALWTCWLRIPCNNSC